MEQRKPRTRGRLFRQLLTFYLLILLVPMVISGCMYGVSLRVIQEEIDRSNVAALKRIQYAVDRQLAELEAAARSLSFNPDVIRLVHTQQIGTEERLLLNRVQGELRTVASGNPGIGDLFLQFRLSGEILKPSESWHISELQPAVRSEDALPAAVDAQIITGEQVSVNTTEPGFLLGKTAAAPALYLTQSLPIELMSHPLATLGFQVEPGILGRTLSGFNSGETGFYFLLDANGSILDSGAPGGFDLSGLLRRMGEAPDARSMMLEGERVVVNRIQSERYGLTYLSAAPEAVYNRRLYAIRALFAVSLAVCLMIGGLLSVFFTRRNYHPVDDILSKIRTVSDPQAGRMNEYDLIRETIGRLLQDNDETHRRLDEQLAALVPIESLDNGVNARTMEPFTEVLPGVRTIDGMKQTIMGILDQMEELDRESRRERREAAHSDILDYVEARLFDPNLNVSSVADHFGMSTDGISRLFRRQAGAGLLHHISVRRVECAIERMRCPGMTVKRIAESCGFGTPDTFIRVFKKIKGVTPGRYMEMTEPPKTDETLEVLSS